MRPLVYIPIYSYIPHVYVHTDLFRTEFDPGSCTPEIALLGQVVQPHFVDLGL